MLNEKTKLGELFISENDSLYKAIEVIDKAGHGTTKIALVVDNDMRLIGILNDGDIRRALLKNASLKESVLKYMTLEYKYIHKYDSRAKALAIMNSFSISQLPVLNENQKVVGIHFLRDFISIKPKSNVVVIMAGGKGTRLRPITENLPKPMIKVAGKPILEHIIHHLIGYGFKNIYLSVNYKAEVIKKYFLNGREHGCSINYLHENKPLGTAGALSLLPDINDDIILMNGDLITQFNISKMLELHKKKNNSITIGARDHIETISYGVLEVEQDKVVDVKEKPQNHYLVNGGIYIIKSEVLNVIPKNTMYFATDLISELLKKKQKIGYYLLDEEWLDVGEHEQLKQAQGIM
jgi:dTDP-glucose pyrophosphorylase